MYLELIAEALKVNSGNKGTLRRDIWQYLLDYYASCSDYLDFLRAIRTLIADGKLKNEEGIYTVEVNTYKEFTTKWKKTPSPVRSVKPNHNPLLSAKARSQS